MIRIAVDTIVTRPGSVFGGIFEYTRILLEQFRRLAPEYGVEITTYAGSGYAPEIAGLAESANYHTKICPLMDNLRRWRFFGGARQVRRDGQDVLFSNHGEMVSVPGMPFVVMLHDTHFLRYRQYDWMYTTRLHALFWLCARSARLVLTNSEASKHDLVHFLKIPPERVVVSYLGCKHDVYNLEPAPEQLAAVRERFLLRRPYILHHGTLQPRKNLRRLIQAYERLATGNGAAAGYDLVLAGNYGWNCQDVIEAAAKVKAPARVVLTGLLQEQDLAALVKGAYLSVIPALWEGFCFPMVESMACGIPTVVADNSCLPEISGGILEYFDAESLDQIADAMERGLRDEELRARLRRDGLRRAAEFSWERCARETLSAIKQVGESSRTTQA